MGSFRKERMSDLLLSFVAGELRRLGDVRLDLVTITAVDMTPDLKTAWVYWTLADVASGAAAAESVAEVLPTDQRGFPSEQRVAEAEAALKGVVGLLKRRAGEELQLRYTPHLRFKFDGSSQYASRIESLLKKAGY